MKEPVVIIGIGQMGGVFARGLLRLGHPVYPVTRDMNLSEVAEIVPEPKFVLLAVAEADFQTCLDKIPPNWASKLVLLQNELLPKDWQSNSVSEPTVISVWFEKKPGHDPKVVLSSPAHGEHAQTLVDALATLDIPAHRLSSTNDLVFELVRKNVYILTTNISGLVCGGVVGDLWENNQGLAREIANDVMDIQEALTGTPIDRERQISSFIDGIQAGPQHKCMGRSAPARLARALSIADQSGLAVPKLREIAAGQ